MTDPHLKRFSPAQMAGPSPSASASPESNTRRCILLICTVMLLGSTGCRNYRQPCAPPPYTPYNTAPTFNGNPQYNGNPQFNGAPPFNGAPQFNTAPNFNNGFPSGGNGGSGFNSSAQSRIQSPPTYSLNIPGNNNPNSYRVGQLPGGLINTRTTAPTPVNRPANYNQQQGWRRSDGNDLNTSSTNQIQTGGGNRIADGGPANSVLESSVRIDRSSASSSAGSGARTASLNNASVNVNGIAFTQSNDYRTTATDERRDSTRLPVTDATNVRSTTSFAPASNGGPQYVQPYYQPRYASLPPTTFNRGSFVDSSFRQGPVTQTFQGSFAQPQQQVLAQSTTRYDPYQSTASTASGDWRNRGRDSQSF